jgi:hypothetical protein
MMHIPGAGGLEVLVNNTRVYHYKAIWVRVHDIASGMYKLSYQHGHTTASANGGNIPDLRCQMTCSGGALHVYLNDIEVRTHDAVIEIVYAS